MSMSSPYAAESAVNLLCSGSSIIHRIAPAVKIIAAVLWSFQVALLTSMQGALFSLTWALAMLLCARISISIVIKRLLVVNMFIIFIWLMMPFSFSTPGEVIAVFGPLSVTREGVRLALLLTLKANAIVISCIVLLSTTSIYRLAASLHTLKIPGKLIVLFILTIRYFHVIYDEYSRLRNAMKIRGFHASGYRWHTYTTLASLIGILLIRSIYRSERIYQAMLCRGYHGTFHFQSIPLVIKRNEWLFSIFMCVSILAAWVI